jgi:PPOX class probable FMN-dependent enzyme
LAHEIHRNPFVNRTFCSEEMKMSAFDHVVTSLEELRGVVQAPAPGARTLLKERAMLDAHCRAFIARSPLLLMATADAHGRCDVSPKGDAPGFVHVLDERRLAIPDRPGNRRLDGMQNLVTNSHVGLLFLVPGRDETLRVNGRACITRDPELLQRSAVLGKTPLLAIGVEVEQCFFHCAKAFLRARLWAQDSWPPRDSLPSFACMLFDQIRPAGATVDDYERDIAEGNVVRLY